MRWLSIVVLVTAALVQAQVVPTELEDCLGPTTTACFETSTAPIDSGCGADFEAARGRVSWPPLEHVGPVTISVQTMGTNSAILPLYIEVSSVFPDGTECRPAPGLVVLVARGTTECGGTWESVGPIDLRRSGVPLGTNYSIVATFFRTSPGSTIQTIGLRCIRVTTAQSPVSGTLWGSVKRLYR
jgi:hypothetical protein